MPRAAFSYPTSDLAPATSDVRNRLRLVLFGFAILALAIFLRLIALELHDGPDYRAMAAEPLTRHHSIPATRGRIVTADGTVLAYDRQLMCLAVPYRLLEQPADPAWLRRTARSRQSPVDRRDSRKILAAQEQVLHDREELCRQLQTICGITPDDWQLRAARIQKRVESIAAAANANRSARENQELQRCDESNSEEFDFADWPTLIGHTIVDALFASDEPPPPNITVREELAEHIVCEDLSLEAVAEIQSHPAQFPGIKLITKTERVYPQNELAPHVVGYLGHLNADELADQQANSQRKADDHTADEWIGRAGLERQYESLLRGQPGSMIDQLDVRGNVITSKVELAPMPGRDLIISLDPVIERTAQCLLDQALARRLASGNDQLDAASGGALIVVDINSGEILAAATAPRFDPNEFVQAGHPHVAHWLNDPAHPLLDRSVQMALPPGSVFKIISAAAVLDAGADPQAPVDCQGYLHQPDALRCAIFKRDGVGHGPVTLADALARSCNVYFFHHAEQFGAAPIIDWARRFQLGRSTGIDLPGEAGGNLPTNRPAQNSDVITLASATTTPSAADPRLLAIGQGPLTATPLQIVRVAAAIGNGGKLITPHLAIQPSVTVATESHPIPGLSAEMIDAIRAGLRRAVTDPEGTAHATVESAEVAIAGKTGTAQTGKNQPDDAWFAGYAPADHPRVAFVVVLEHAGNADTAAGPVVRHLVERMNDLGYFADQKSSALKADTSTRLKPAAFSPATSQN